MFHSQAAEMNSEGARTGVKPPRTTSPSFPQSSMRKWETPLPCGSPSTGFLPLVELVHAWWVHTSVFRFSEPFSKDAGPASHRVRFWRGGACVQSPTSSSFLQWPLAPLVEQREGRSSAAEAQLLP